MPVNKGRVEAPIASAVVDVSVYFTGGGRAKATGAVTGRIYKFDAGVPTMVHPDDLDELLAITRKGGCCGQERKGRVTTLFALG